MKKHVQLLYRGSISRIKVAVSKANEILGDPEFYHQIKSYDKFENTVLSPFYLAKIIEECSVQILVDSSPFFSLKASRIVAHDHITLNRRDFRKSMAERIDLLIYLTVEALATRYKTIKKETDPFNRLRAAPPIVIGHIARVMVK